MIVYEPCTAPAHRYHDNPRFPVAAERCSMRLLLHVAARDWALCGCCAFSWTQVCAPQAPCPRTQAGYVCIVAAAQVFSAYDRVLEQAPFRGRVEKVDVIGVCPGWFTRYISLRIMAAVLPFAAHACSLCKSCPLHIFLRSGQTAAGSNLPIDCPPLLMITQPS